MNLSNYIEVDSIIFDLDGTLWNSSDVVIKAWQKTIDKEEQVREPITKEKLESFMGLQLHQIGEKYLGYLDEKVRIEILKKCCRAENEMLVREGGILYPELENTLKVLSEKFPLFIVSNCENGYIEAFLAYHKLGKYFKDFECPGKTGLSKGENIRLIIERNKLKKPIYVGDTQGDCEAARKAGLPFVYASYGFGKVEKYDYSIDGIKEVAELTAALR